MQSILDLAIRLMTWKKKIAKSQLNIMLANLHPFFFFFQSSLIKHESQHKVVLLI